MRHQAGATVRVITTRCEILIASSVRWDSNAAIAKVIDENERLTGFHCGQAYPPVSMSPLYLPATRPLYSHVNGSERVFSNSKWWRGIAAVTPHRVFLSSLCFIEGFAASARKVVKRKWRRILPAPQEIQSPCKEYPEIAVVILTARQSGRSPESALRSVASQDYFGPIHVLLLGDNCPSLPEHRWDIGRPQGFSIVNFNVIGIPGLQHLAPIERVARLRNIALQLVNSPYVCFLDDDNRWEPNHLSLCHTRLLERGVQAVHSWRRLFGSNGRSWHPDRFPWMPPGDDERRLYAIYTKYKVLDPQDSVVRDQVSLVVDGREYGMVDLGEWLFETSFLRTFNFDIEYSADDLRKNVGEDDKLLCRLRARGVPTACTEQATLLYYLGGISNRLNTCCEDS